jgi:hypothetical protein
MGDEILELVVYPELTVRSQPWKFWGRVRALPADIAVVIVEQLTGEQAGTLVTIPYRYFQDGRVFRSEIPDE